MSFYLRADLLNALNYKNLTDVNATIPDVFPDHLQFRTATSPAIPRTFKFSMGFKF